MTDPFTLEGRTYYRQRRPCSRAGCACQRGALHGPYWYCRELLTGREYYVGKTLPEALRATQQAHAALLPEMHRLRGLLAERFNAVGRLARGAALSAADRDILCALGLAAALLDPPTTDPPPTADPP